MLRTLEWFKEEMYSHLVISFLSCIQHFGLECRVLEDRMRIILINPMQNCMFNIVHDHEKTYAPSWRSFVLSLRSSDKLGAQLLLEHSNDLSTCIALDRQMVDGRHLMMDDISHYYDGSFLMRTSHLNEKIFPTTCLEPYGLNVFIDE